MPSDKNRDESPYHFFGNAAFLYIYHDNSLLKNLSPCDT